MLNKITETPETLRWQEFDLEYYNIVFAYNHYQALNNWPKSWKQSFDK